MKNTGIVYHSTERTPTVLAELAGLLPPLSGEQLAALEADLLQNGCYSPVIVNEELVIVDGHNRQSLCEKHGIPYNMACSPLRICWRPSSGRWTPRRAAATWTNGSWARSTLKLRPEIEVQGKGQPG